MLRSSPFQVMFFIDDTKQTSLVSSTVFPCRTYGDFIDFESTTL